MRNTEQPHGLTLLERADAWVRWLRDPDRSYNPNAYGLLADLLVDMQQENHRVASGVEMEAIAEVIEDLENDGTGWCAKVRWLYNPIPTGEQLYWPQPQKEPHGS